MDTAVIFDLDGTLWDATDQVLLVWNEVFRRHGVTLTVTADAMRAVTGKTPEEIGQALLGELPPERRAPVMEDCGRGEVEYLRAHGGCLYEGVEDMLRALAGRYALCLVSNCQAGYAQAFLDAHGLRRWFDECVEAGDSGLSKGANLRLLARRRGFTRAVYVGDTEGDEAAARDAGMGFIHAAYGFGEALSPDGVIRSLAELPSLAGTLLG